MSTDHPGLEEQLAVIAGRRLTQFSMAVNGVRLAFWAEDAVSIGQEVFIEGHSLMLGHSGEAMRRYRWNDDVVATALLSALDHTVTRIDVTDGQLSLDFDNELRVRVEPDQDYESWQISSGGHLLIVCTPGGEVAIWYPDATG